MNTFEIIKVATKHGFEMRPSKEGMVFKLPLQPCVTAEEQKQVLNGCAILAYTLGEQGATILQMAEVKTDTMKGVIIQTNIQVTQSG